MGSTSHLIPQVILGAVALAAIAAIVLLIIRLIGPPPASKPSSGDVCPGPRLCPSRKGAWVKPQCCLPTETCYLADALCCEKRFYTKGEHGKGSGSCCPKDQRTLSGSCCALGQIASGDNCVLPCPKPPYVCEDSSECVEIDYSSLSQGASLTKSLGSELSYNDTAQRRAFACLPPPQECEQQFAPALMPASIGNTELGYKVGRYNFTETDLCPSSNDAGSTSGCVLDQLAKGTSSLAEVEKEFRIINQLQPDNVGQWCGSPSETFLVRSVPGMQDCGWKKCVEQLSYEGLQHVRYNTQTGACAGIFTPREKGITVKGGWLKGDSPCQFNSGDCDVGDSFCQHCLDGPGLSGYKCEAGGEVSRDIKTVNNWYCSGTGALNERCAPCHFSGSNPSPSYIKCSQTGKPSYPTQDACVAAEQKCRGICEWGGADHIGAPWEGLCSQDIDCSCSCDKFQNIWKNSDQSERNKIVGSVSNRCAKGTIPCPSRRGGKCLCHNDFPFTHCHAQNFSGCPCDCLPPEACTAAVES